MATTYTLISSVTVGSGGAANREFTSIPQTYTDLVVFTSCRSNRSSTEDIIKLEPNSATTSLSARSVNNQNGSVASSTETRIDGGIATAANSTANTFGNNYCYIPNYTSSNYKSFSIDATNENNSTDIYQLLEAALWSNTAAITSIKLVPNVGSAFTQYSTAYLYGISNA
jgi:hypothetical protein